MQSILAVGVIALFHAVHLEAECIAVQTNGSAIGLSYVEGYELGAKHISHGFLCRKRRREGSKNEVRPTNEKAHVSQASEWALIQTLV